MCEKMRTSSSLFNLVNRNFLDFVSGTDGAAGVNGQKKDKDSAGGSAGGGSRHSGGGGCFRSLFCCLKIRSKKPKPEHNNPPVAPLANTTAAEQPATVSQFF